MKHLLFALSLISGFCLINSGCGGSDSSPSDESSDQALESGQDGAQASSGLSLESPEELAKYVHASVLSNDFEVFRKACVTVEDVENVRDLAVSDKEKENMQKRIDKINADPAAHEAKLREFFDKIVSAVHEAGAYDVELIAAEEPRRLYEGTKTKRLWKIYVCLTNGWYFGIDAPILIDGRWLVYDDDPLVYFETESHHRENKIADGFSSEGMEIAKP